MVAVDEGCAKGVGWGLTSSGWVVGGLEREVLTDVEVDGGDDERLVGEGEEVEAEDEKTPDLSGAERQHWGAEDH